MQRENTRLVITICAFTWMFEIHVLLSVLFPDTRVLDKVCETWYSLHLTLRKSIADRGNPSLFNTKRCATAPHENIYHPYYVACCRDQTAAQVQSRFQLTSSVSVASHSPEPEDDANSHRSWEMQQLSTGLYVTSKFKPLDSDVYTEEAERFRHPEPDYNLNGNGPSA